MEEKIKDIIDNAFTIRFKASMDVKWLNVILKEILEEYTSLKKENEELKAEIKRLKTKEDIT